MNPARHFMNPAVAKHLGSVPSSDQHDATTRGHGEDHSHLPHVHVHPHGRGVTVHAMHPDGTHEKSEHPDAESALEKINEHLGTGGEGTLGGGGSGDFNQDQNDQEESGRGAF